MPPISLRDVIEPSLGRRVLILQIEQPPATERVAWSLVAGALLVLFLLGGAL